MCKQMITIVDKEKVPLKKKKQLLWVLFFFGGGGYPVHIYIKFIDETLTHASTLDLRVMAMKEYFTFP